MSRLSIYENKVHRVILGGVSLDDNRSDPYFKIAPLGPAYVTEGPGADGSFARCGTNNNGYEITLSFKGVSSCNNVLSAFHIADRKAFNGAGVMTLTAEDESGTSLIVTDRCWIESMAEQAFGITKPDTNWKLIAIIEPGQFFLGGN
jgi:hypothetical protein